MPRLVVVLFLLAAGPPAVADDVERPIALVGGTVWVDGRTIVENGTVVLEGGLIVAVGPADEVVIPAAARLVQLDGEWVYPAFIEASSHLGVQDVEVDAKRLAARAGRRIDAGETPPVRMPEGPTKGLFPERSVVDLLVLGADDGARYRRAGFGAVATGPKDGYFRGTMAVVALSGRPRREALLAEGVALDVTTAYRAKGYPGTTMGVLAYFRQFLHDGLHHRELRAHYERAGRRGLVRPPIDPALAALEPVLDRTRPIHFHATDENDVRRALGLATEFGLALRLVGGGEAHRLAGELAAMGVPVVLGLAWPEEPDDPDVAEPDETGDEKNPDDEKKPDEKEPDEKEPEPLRVRREKRRLWLERATGAVALHEAGVDLALTSAGLDQPTALLARIARLVEWGLPVEAAERALTTGPAALFGLERQLGTIEVGKAASVSILSGRLGGEKVAVRRVFVDGVEFDLAEGSDMDGPPAEGVDLSGTWEVAVTTDDGQFAAGLELTMAEDGALTGALRSPMGLATIEEGKVSGRRVRVVLAVSFGEQEFELVLHGSLDEGGRLGGTAELGWDGSIVRWKATRPERDR